MFIPEKDLEGLIGQIWKPKRPSLINKRNFREQKESKNEAK